MRFTVKTMYFYLVMATLTAGLFANDGVKREHLPDYKQAKLEPVGHDVVPGYEETKPINDVIHSATPREQQPQANVPKVQEHTGPLADTGNDFTKEDLKDLMRRYETKNPPLNQDELMRVENFLLQSQEQKKSTINLSMT